MADEYTQIAAIVCSDLKMLSIVAENETYDADFLRGMIKMTKEKMDEVISNPEMREMRYNAMCGIASILRAEDNGSEEDS